MEGKLREDWLGCVSIRKGGAGESTHERRARERERRERESEREGRTRASRPLGLARERPQRLGEGRDSIVPVSRLEAKEVRDTNREKGGRRRPPRTFAIVWTLSRARDPRDQCADASFSRPRFFCLCAYLNSTPPKEEEKGVFRRAAARLLGCLEARAQCQGTVTPSRRPSPSGRARR